MCVVLTNAYNRDATNHHSHFFSFANDRKVSRARCCCETGDSSSCRAASPDGVQNAPRYRTSPKRVRIYRDYGGYCFVLQIDVQRACEMNANTVEQPLQVDPQGFPGLVMPFYSQGSLEERLENDLDISFEQKKLWSSQIAAGLGHLRAAGIFHRDISSR